MSKTSSILVTGASEGIGKATDRDRSSYLTDSSSREQAAPDIRYQFGLPAAAAASVVGLAYAAISAYWALGGTWLLATVSSSLVTAHQSATAVMAVWAAVVLKAVGASAPLVRLPPRPTVETARPA